MTRLRDEGKVSGEEEEARELSPRMMAEEQALWDLEKKTEWMAGPGIMGQSRALIESSWEASGLRGWSFLGAAGGWGWGWGECGVGGRWTSAG